MTVSSPELNSDRNKNNILFYSVLAGLIFLLILFFVVYTKTNNTGQIANSNQPSNKPTSQLVKPVNYALPDVVSKDSSLTTLPMELKDLLIPDAKITSIFKATYPNSQQGFYAQLDASGYPLVSIVNIYTALGSSKSSHVWKIQKAGYTTNSGSVNLESESYKAQIDISQSENKTTRSVIIKIINK
jgi:hypothetical protein